MPNLLASRVGRLTAFSLLYVSEGLPQGFALQAVTVQMRRIGLGTAEVGAFAGVILLPWAWKWAVGPVVDLFYVDRLGRRRAWIVACQLLMALTILAAWPVNMTSQLNLFAALLIVHNVFAATQDVAIDALAVTALREDERGLAGGLMFAGAYTGTAIGGATLYLADWVGFSWAFPATAGSILAITAGVTLWLREPRTPPASAQSQPQPAPSPTVPPELAASPAGPAVLEYRHEEQPGRFSAATREVAGYAATAAKAMFGSRAAVAGLIFALLPAGAMALSSALAQTLQVDLGLSDNTIATLGLVGSIVAAGGCVLGGWVSDRIGRRPTLSACVVLTAVPTAVMALGMWR
ncbi:MAG TPA: MFS transporter, partial [Humisphaera sp.]